MLVQVYYTGDSFVAFDQQGNRITNRGLLEAISFEPFPGFKSSVWLDIPEVAMSTEDNISNIHINVNT